MLLFYTNMGRGAICKGRGEGVGSCGEVGYADGLRGARNGAGTVPCEDHHPVP